MAMTKGCGSVCVVFCGFTLTKGISLVTRPHCPLHLEGWGCAALVVQGSQLAESQAFGNCSVIRRVSGSRGWPSFVDVRRSCTTRSIWSDGGRTSVMGGSAT